MTKRIEVECGGVTVSAVLLEQEAPLTTQKFWDVLPIEQTMRHVRWGGNSAYTLVQSLKDPSFPVENRIAYYFPATIALKPEHGELAFSYGQSQARSLSGNGWACHFANIEGDAGPFLAMLARTQHEGGKPLSIRRKEG